MGLHEILGQGHGIEEPTGDPPSNQRLSVTTIPWSATQPFLVLSRNAPTQHCVTSLKSRSVFNSYHIHWVRSFGIIQIRITDPRSLGSW